MTDIRRTLNRSQRLAKAGSLVEATPPPHDADAVLERINALTGCARAAGVAVVFVQHERDGSPLQRGSEKWQLDRRLVVGSLDVTLHKTTPDSFLRTELGDLLARWGTQRLVICGYASEFCVIEIKAAEELVFAT